MGVEMAGGREAFGRGPLWLHVQPALHLLAGLQKEALWRLPSYLGSQHLPGTSTSLSSPTPHDLSVKQTLSSLYKQESVAQSG